MTAPSSSTRSSAWRAERAGEEVAAVGRRELDYYSTPPCAALALRAWLDAHPSALGSVVPPACWLDPSAGPGLLLEVAVPDRDERVALELDPRWRRDLERVARRVVIADALETDWRQLALGHPMGVVANPPYSLLRPFVDRCIAWARDRHTVACVLVRTAWLQTASQLSVPWPTYALHLTWRPSFTGDGSTDRFTSYTWAVWVGPYISDRTDQGVSWRLRRPTVPPALAARHRALARASQETA